MSGEDERQFARALIAQVLEDHARNEITAGRAPPNAQEEEDLAAAIHAALFGVGRLQPLLDDPHIENIDINGCDRVFLGYADGREVMAEPVAENDDELVELIQVLAAYSGLSSRPFDSANPQLDLRLPDGARLSAVMDVTLRPAVSIRRARLGKVFLADLVGNGTLLPEAATFLAAATAARKNIMIAGATNAGKTTLLRAIVNQIPPGERLITVERALELGIDHFPELHPNVVAFEERLPNFEGQGAITMAELVRRSLRMNPSRVIVGEVLGDEIVTMLNAMSQGNDGSLSTIHANSSLEVFNRIATYAIQSAERLPVEATHMLIAGAIDFVVFIEKRNEYARRAGCAGSSAASGRSPAWMAGCCPARCSPRARTAGRCRTRRCPAWTNWPSMATTRPGGAGEQPVSRRPAARRPARRGGRRRAAPAGGGAARAAARAAGPPVRPAAAAAPGARRAPGRAGPAGRRAGAAATRWVVGRDRRGAARAGLADARRGGGGAARHGPAGGAGHLDRVAARHDRRRGRPGAGHPRVAAGGRAVAAGAAGPAGGPAAHPDADAGGAAPVRRRPGRPQRGPDHRRADHQRPAARPGPAGPAGRAVRGRSARSWTCAGRSTPSAGPPGAAPRSWCGVSVGLALGLALFNPGYVHVYDSPLGQLVLVVVVALYAAGFIWMRRLATFETPERLLGRAVGGRIMSARS